MPSQHLQPLEAGAGLFRSFQIGLTATPDNRTFGYFNQNLVSDYGYEKAVIDGVLELAKSHAQKLLPARKLFGFMVSFVAINTSVKDFMRDELHQLREDVFALIHMY